MFALNVTKTIVCLKQLHTLLIWTHVCTALVVDNFCRSYSFRRNCILLAVFLPPSAVQGPISGCCLVCRPGTNQWLLPGQPPGTNQWLLGQPPETNQWLLPGQPPGPLGHRCSSQKHFVSLALPGSPVLSWDLLSLLGFPGAPGLSWAAPGVCWGISGVPGGALEVIWGAFWETFGSIFAAAPCGTEKVRHFVEYQAAPQRLVG